MPDPLRHLPNLKSSHLTALSILPSTSAHLTCSTQARSHLPSNLYIHYIHIRHLQQTILAYHQSVEMAAPKKSSGTNKTATTARKVATKASSASQTTATGSGNTRKGKRKAEEPVSSTAAATKSRKLNPAKRVAKSRTPKPKLILNHRATDALNVYVFGSGDSGVLGLGPRCSTDDVVRPRLNPNLSASSVGVVQMATGGMHCVALTNDNKIVTWGVNDHGALGRDTQWSGGWKEIDGKDENDDSDSSESELNPKESTPTAIDESCFPANTVFTQVAAGDNASFALTEEGLVYGWGTFKVK